MVNPLKISMPVQPRKNQMEVVLVIGTKGLLTIGKLRRQSAVTFPFVVPPGVFLFNESSLEL